MAGLPGLTSINILYDGRTGSPPATLAGGTITAQRSHSFRNDNVARRDDRFVADAMYLVGFLIAEGTGSLRCKVDVAYRQLTMESLGLSLSGQHSRVSLSDQKPAQFRVLELTRCHRPSMTQA